MGFLNRLWGGRSREEPPEFVALLDQSMEELRAKTAGHQGAWRIGEVDWNVDQDAGRIIFTSPNGMKAEAPVQIIGTFNTLDSTWLWGWDHPSVSTPLQADAKRVREFGEQKGITRLTTRKLVCSEDECWQLCALACKLCKAQGVYRGPAGTTMIFMTFGLVKLSKV